MLKPTLKLPATNFKKFKSYLTELGFKFENRPHQEFLARKNGIAVNLYSNGKVVIAGSNTSLIDSICIFIKNIGAQEIEKSIQRIEPLELPFPHIGTDEVGKGDYFGHLIVAGTLVTTKVVESLKEIGVKDSKRLSDITIRNLASKIRALLGPHCFEVITISPLKYNILYKRMQNINKILGWAHARAIENLLADTESCNLAVADKFGDPGYIRNSLMSLGKRIELKQITKAERDLAVAAASILARDMFLHKRDEMNETYNDTFPKGATNVIPFGKKIIESYGISILPNVAKLHFSTTLEITGGKVPSIERELEKQTSLETV